MKTNVLLDVDGCIANFYCGFANYLNKTYGTNLNVNAEPTNYAFENWGTKCGSIDMDKASQDWILKGGFRDIPAYANAKEFVKELHKIANVFVVTARIGDFKQKFEDNVIQRIKEDTAHWFKDNKIFTNTIVFCHKKVEFCKDNTIPILIEDKLETALLGAKSGIHSILINRPWNEHPERLRIYRAFNYDDVLDYIEKLNK